MEVRKSGAMYQASPFFQVLRTVPIWKFMKWVEGVFGSFDFAELLVVRYYMEPAPWQKKTLGRAHVANLWPLNAACFTPSLCCGVFYWTPAFRGHTVGQEEESTTCTHDLKVCC